MNFKLNFEQFSVTGPIIVTFKFNKALSTLMVLHFTLMVFKTQDFLNLTLEKYTQNLIIFPRGIDIEFNVLELISHFRSTKP